MILYFLQQLHRHGFNSESALLTLPPTAVQIVPNYCMIYIFLLFFCSKERQYYYGHRELAKRNKRECMSVIIDGMDQAKTNLPHFSRERKCGHGLWKMRYVNVTIFFVASNLKFVLYRTHLTGAISHGYGVHCYIDLLTWPHDANLVINVLVDVILKRQRLPPVLYLQLDNTARENKNQYVMAFLAYLVQAGVFKEVSCITVLQTYIIMY